MIKNSWILIVLLIQICTGLTYAQPLPAIEENIPFLITFGKDASKTWGDDDNSQIIFVSIPENNSAPFFVRVFDADVGGEHDEIKQGFNTSTKFEILGGANCFSKIDQENKDPIGNYGAGQVMYSQVFSEGYGDNAWHTFGPINPAEGQLEPDLGGRIFKILVKGLSGDDGNLYRIYLSNNPVSNIDIEGANMFTFEYAFRLNAKAGSISHIYPYVDNQTIAVKQENFDLDSDAYIKIVTMSNPGFKVVSSADGQWGRSEHPVTEKEKNTCLDVQFIKTGSVGNNNLVFSITNQYGKFLPFHSVPIGVIPKRKIGIKAK